MTETFTPGLYALGLLSEINNYFFIFFKEYENV